MGRFLGRRRGALGRTGKKPQEEVSGYEKASDAG